MVRVAEGPQCAITYKIVSVGVSAINRIGSYCMTTRVVVLALRVAFACVVRVNRVGRAQPRKPPEKIDRWGSSRDTACMYSELLGYVPGAQEEAKPTPHTTLRLWCTSGGNVMASLPDEPTSLYVVKSRPSALKSKIVVDFPALSGLRLEPLMSIKW